jgi:FkbM family methyltransferase
MIKLLLKKIVFLPLHLLELISKLYLLVFSSIKPTIGEQWKDYLILNNSNRISEVIHQTTQGGWFSGKFQTNNGILRMRAETFSSKEPDTLQWLDSGRNNEVLFDIGANVGLYSIYFATTKKGRVYAFEPSPYNLGVLIKNVGNNNLSNRITVIPNPLSESTGMSAFNFSNTDEGGSHSSFGVDYGFDGQRLRKVLSYETLGFSLDDMYQIGMLNEYPSLMKIDVDGIENLILSGAKKMLRHPQLREILIEVTETFQNQKTGVESILNSCGFSLKSKSLRLGTVPFANQIWARG